MERRLWCVVIFVSVWLSFSLFGLSGVIFNFGNDIRLVGKSLGGNGPPLLVINVIRIIKEELWSA